MADDRATSKSPDDSKKQSKEERRELQEIDIPAEVEPYLKDLPEPQLKAVEAIIVALSVKKSSWRSPLPPPEVLAGYNHEIERGAERILIMAEKQSAHRIAMEVETTRRAQNQSGRGQLFAFIIAIAFLIASFTLIFYGHEVSGSILGTIDLIALVSVFIVGKKIESEETKK